MWHSFFKYIFLFIQAPKCSLRQSFLFFFIVNGLIFSSLDESVKICCVYEMQDLSLRRVFNLLSHFSYKIKTLLHENLYVISKRVAM